MIKTQLVKTLEVRSRHRKSSPGSKAYGNNCGVVTKNQTSKVVLHLAGLTRFVNQCTCETLLFLRFVTAKKFNNLRLRALSQNTASSVCRMFTIFVFRFGLALKVLIFIVSRSVIYRTTQSIYVYIVECIFPSIYSKCNKNCEDLLNWLALPISRSISFPVHHFKYFDVIEIIYL